MVCNRCLDTGEVWRWECGREQPTVCAKKVCDVHGECVRGSRVLNCDCGVDGKVNQHSCSKCRTLACKPSYLENDTLGKKCFECGHFEVNEEYTKLWNDLREAREHLTKYGPGPAELYDRCGFCRNVYNIKESCECQSISETYQSDNPPTKTETKVETWRDRPPML